MLKWNEGNLLLALNAAEVALWTWNVDTDKITLCERACELWGVPENQEVTFEDLSAHIFPHDLDSVRAAFAATRAPSPDVSKLTSASPSEKRFAGFPPEARVRMRIFQNAICVAFSSTSPTVNKPKKPMSFSPAR